MAGTVVQTRTTNPGKVKIERIVTLTCVSDASDGTTPDTTMAGLAGYELREVITTPGTAPPTTAYRVYITSANSGRMFLGSDRSAAGAEERQSGHEDLGYYPAVDGTITLRVAATANTNAANIGNSKNLVITLRFAKRS